MNIRLVLISTFALACFNARAFVVELNATGDALRWHLNPLEPTVPPNPEGTGVHTNVVNPTTKAIRYFLASDAYSTTNKAAELNAVRAAFAQWQSIPGTFLKFEDAGFVAPGVDVNTADDQNVIFWARTNMVNGGNDNISGALGVTFNSYFPDDNAQAEADIVFNGVDYSWFTDFNSAVTTRQFVESTALHEIGHFLGLKHSPVGGATMLFQGGGGVNVQAGLSSDEVAAAKWLYGQTATLATLGRLKGVITMNGSAVFGAAVFAEDVVSGNVIAGTVSRADGTYDLPAMPPGEYRVRVTPLDSAGASDFLVRGRDINAAYDPAQTGFLPKTNAPITITAGLISTQNFAVTGGNPSFRITQIRATDSNAGAYRWSSLPTSIHVGQSNLFVGVASADLPTSGATLTLTGDGLSVGAPAFATNIGQNLHFISVPISVASNAMPGLRSFVVTSGNDVAYASGFLDVQPATPDFNFDGLDDRFQRQYFPLFTAPDAGPGADPDNDGFDNEAEYIAGTVPTNALSTLEIESVTLNATGSTVTWQSVAGKRYQVFSRLDLGNAPWQAIGSPVTATNDAAQFTDAAATNAFRFYRVQVLP